MKLKKIQILIILSVLTFSISQIPKNTEKLEKNQKSTYPNTYEAPVMASQIPNSKYQAPKFSRSLFETDARRKLRKADFLHQVNFASYQMSRGELEQIFNFVDQDKDDLVDQKEWDAFTGLYILPFEACDKTSKYLLTKAEFKTCFDADPRSALIKFRRRYEKNYDAMIIDVVSTKGNDEINFSDYLFVRRSLFGWKQCQSNAKYMSISAFKCAIRSSLPQKYQLKINLEEIYNVGLNLANDKALIELDYISYLRVLYFSYVFSIYSSPHDTPFLEKQQFIKAVKEDRFPMNWEESEINTLYELTNTNPFSNNHVMNFPTFAFYFNLHRLFNKYSLERPLQLSDQELNKLMSDPLSPVGITLAVDFAKTDFSEAQYQEASLVLQRARLNEEGFYYSFKEKNLANQDASLTTAFSHDKKNIKAAYQDLFPNAKNRHIFFTTMTGTDKTFWTKEIFYRAFTLSNLYTSLCHDKRWIVAVSYLLDNLNTQYDKVNPPISQKGRNNYSLYKYLPHDISLDIVSFLALENWSFKIDQHSKSSKTEINETLLKVILTDYGMANLPDTVIDITKTGYDNLRRRVYSSRDTIKNIVIVHSAAAENARNNEYVTMYKLKLNNDPSRKFPNFPRRFMSSPNV